MSCDYFFGLKGNQPSLRDLARGRLAPLAPRWTSEFECEHGRIEFRELKCCELDSDTALFPLARQVVSLTRHWWPKAGGAAKVETRYFITDIELGERTHVALAKLGREQGSVENKNHWRRGRHPLAGGPQRAAQTQRRQEPRPAARHRAGPHPPGHVRFAQRRYRPLHRQTGPCLARLITQPLPPHP